MMASDEWEEVGQIPVDTARITLADPSHLAALAEEQEAFTAKVLSGEIDLNAEIIQGVGDTRQVAVEGDSGTFGPMPVAVEVRSGLGDGLYPVMVRWMEVPGWGRRVAEVRVVFLPDDEPGEEEAAQLRETAARGEG